MVLPIRRSASRNIYTEGYRQKRPGDKAGKIRARVCAVERSV